MRRIRLVLDTNILISALINQESSIRDILLSDRVILYLPEQAINEIEAHKGLILKKSGLTETEFHFTLKYLLKRVQIIKKDYFKKELREAKKMMKNIDVNDSEFLALAMKLQTDGILSNDKAFDKTKTKRHNITDTLQKLR